MSRNLENYETVKVRKKKFYDTFPDGRIIVELMNLDTIEDGALFKASTFKSEHDQAQCLPLSTGYAHEIRDKELKQTKGGKSYESVNYTSWVENCEESAIGRALDNAGFSGNAKCSREEIEQAQKNKVAIENKKRLDLVTELTRLVIIKNGGENPSSEQSQWMRVAPLQQLEEKISGLILELGLNPEEVNG